MTNLDVQVAQEVRQGSLVTAAVGAEGMFLNGVADGMAALVDLLVDLAEPFAFDAGEACR